VGGMASSGYLILESPRDLVTPCALSMMSCVLSFPHSQGMDLERTGFSPSSLRQGTCISPRMGARWCSGEIA